MVPRENKNNAHAKLEGQTKSIMVFSKVAYFKGTLLNLHTYMQDSLVKLSSQINDFLI